MWFTILLSLFCVADGTARPHIVFILADDLGWNDVGFHGSDQIPTPNIDALAYAGLPLHNYYVSPICTPSRSALMTGKYPIHTAPVASSALWRAAWGMPLTMDPGLGVSGFSMKRLFHDFIGEPNPYWIDHGSPGKTRDLMFDGMQHGVIYGAEPRGLPLSEKILPQYLKDLGYKTHLIGKWHLGSYKKEYLPRNRGFDTHTGYITGKIDMYDHTNVERGSWGFDFKRNSDALVSDDLFGKYATDVFTDEAIKIISSHNNSTPLFLMVAHAAVHSGNPYEPIRAPDDVIDQFKTIENRQRQKFAGVLTKLDESVGRVVSALHEHGLLNHSVIVFSTDNGGPAAGFNDNAASNYPLRGVKNTLWEGGVRGAGLVFSPLIHKRSRAATQLMHISDWLPTLYSAAGGNLTALGSIDGVNQWDALSKDLDSERNAVLHNIDDVWGSAALTVWPWKLVQGTNYNGSWDSWYGPAGRRGHYDTDKVFGSRAGKAVAELGLMPNNNTVAFIRKSTTVTCSENTSAVRCKPLQSPCLFNVQLDPCERNNLADAEPAILQRLLKDLSDLNSTAVPPNNRPLDPHGDPKFWSRVYFNFGDFDTPRSR